MGAEPEAMTPLPVRTNRYRRSGRHSSPHQLSLPSDAPALVIAVPGAATPENQETAELVAAVAGASCQGAEVYIGYLRGDVDPLTDVLVELGRRGPMHPTVVVPLIGLSHPGVDAVVNAAIAASGTVSLKAAPLGPHPLLAEALHVRLAEAGLSRATRVGRVNIVTGAEGVIVCAEGGPEAVQGAGVVAVLLASRLTLPVACAPLSEPARIKESAQEMLAAGVASVALAPCAIGPELGPGTLEAVVAQTGLPSAAPMGGHHAIGQLVAIRYGGALVDPQLAKLADNSAGPSGSGTGTRGLPPEARHTAGQRETPGQARDGDGRGLPNQQPPGGTTRSGLPTRR